MIVDLDCSLTQRSRKNTKCPAFQAILRTLQKNKRTHRKDCAHRPMDLLQSLSVCLFVVVKFIPRDCAHRASSTVCVDSRCGGGVFRGILVWVTLPWAHMDSVYSGKLCGTSPLHGRGAPPPKAQAFPPAGIRVFPDQIISGHNLGHLSCVQFTAENQEKLKRSNCHSQTL